MQLSGYIHSPTEPTFIAYRYGMEYLMHNPNKHIMYSRNKIFKLNESPNQCFLKVGGTEIKKLSNTPTSFTHIVMRIMQEISLTCNPSLQQLTSSMAP